MSSVDLLLLLWSCHVLASWTENKSKFFLVHHICYWNAKLPGKIEWAMYFVVLCHCMSVDQKPNKKNRPPLFEIVRIPQFSTYILPFAILYTTTPKPHAFFLSQPEKSCWMFQIPSHFLTIFQLKNLLVDEIFISWRLFLTNITLLCGRFSSCY